MRDLAIDIPHQPLVELCRRYHVTRMAVFGSALHGMLTADSDLDLLVEFEPDAIIGLKFITLQNALTDLFGRSVDLSTPDFLSPHFRERVLDEAVVIYEREG